MKGSSDMGTFRVALLFLSMFNGRANIVPDSCPFEVGSIWDEWTGNSHMTTMTYLFLNETFPCDGYVTSWTYLRLSETPKLYAGVWREEKGLAYYYTLVAITELPVSESGLQTVPLPPGQPIVVKKGDFLGLHYSNSALKNNQFGAIDIQMFITDARELHASRGGKNDFITLTAGYFDENFNVGNVHNFNTNDRQISLMQPALLADVQYFGTYSQDVENHPRSDPNPLNVAGSGFHRQPNVPLIRPSSMASSWADVWEPILDGDPSAKQTKNQESEGEQEGTEKGTQLANDNSLTVPSPTTVDPTTIADDKIPWVYFVASSVATVCVTVFLVWLGVCIRRMCRRRQVAKESIRTTRHETGDQFSSRVDKCLQQNPFYCSEESLAEQNDNGVSFLCTLPTQDQLDQRNSSSSTRSNHQSMNSRNCGLRRNLPSRQEPPVIASTHDADGYMQMHFANSSLQDEANNKDCRRKRQKRQVLHQVLGSDIVLAAEPCGSAPLPTPPRSRRAPWPSKVNLRSLPPVPSRPVPESAIHPSTRCRPDPIYSLPHKQKNEWRH